MLPTHYGTTGDRHTGYDALDCGRCRTDLLEAFRAPAAVPGADGVRRTGHFTGTALVQPPGSPAVQTATCSCGWTKELQLPAGFPPDTARVMAENWAFGHRMYSGSRETP